MSIYSHTCTHTQHSGCTDKYLDGFPYAWTIVTFREAPNTSVSFELVDKAMYYPINQSPYKYVNECMNNGSACGGGFPTPPNNFLTPAGGPTIQLRSTTTGDGIRSHRWRAQSRKTAPPLSCANCKSTLLQVLLTHWLQTEGSNSPSPWVSFMSSSAHRT